MRLPFRRSGGERGHLRLSVDRQGVLLRLEEIRALAPAEWEAAFLAAIERSNAICARYRQRRIDDVTRAAHRRHPWFSRISGQARRACDERAAALRERTFAGLAPDAAVRVTIDACFAVCAVELPTAPSAEMVLVGYNMAREEAHRSLEAAWLEPFAPPP